LLEQLAELRKHFPHNYPFIVKNSAQDTEEHLDGRDVRAGKSVKFPDPLQVHYRPGTSQYIQQPRNIPDPTD
jgi:hypothetical protein